MKSGKQLLLEKLKSQPPTWPKNPRQDSYGNPTTKKPGDVGTVVRFPRKGKQKWYDQSGRFKPHSSKE